MKKYSISRYLIFHFNLSNILWNNFKTLTFERYHKRAETMKTPAELERITTFLYQY